MDIFKRIFILIVTLSVTTSCGTENVLSEVSNKETDEAYYIDAKKELDNMQWDSTVTIITSKMSANYQARRDVKMTLASAYAGKCGLIFMDLIQGMTNNPSSAMFQFFMGVWGGKTVNPDSCELAIGVLQGIGTKTQRTTNENLFLSLLGVARIGTNLVANLDNGDHNGAMDTDATVCHGDAAGTGTAWQSPLSTFFPTPPGGMTQYMTSNNMKRVAAGLGLILENLDALTGALGSGSSLDGIDDISTMCSTVMSTITGSSVSCDSMTTTGAVTDEMVYAMRMMLASSDFGLGSTCTVTGTTTFLGDVATYLANWPTPNAPPADVCCPSTAIPGVH